MKKRLPLLDQLPSILEPTIVNELLVEILTNENSFSDISRHEMAEYILELIEKLSDTYALLNETQSDLILKWIENNFSYSEEQYFDLLYDSLSLQVDKGTKAQNTFKGIEGDLIKSDVN